MNTVEMLKDLARKYESGMPFVSIDYNETKIKFAIPNEKCLYFALSIAEREPTTNKWILSFSEGETFFDIGANNGVYGLIASMMSKCMVYAFEPHFGSSAVTVQNVFANGISERMKIYPLAISDTTGYGDLFLSATTAGKSLNNFGEARPSADALWNATIPQAAISTTIDDFVRSTGVFPNHIKVDVDGIEPKIIKGAMETIRDPRLMSIRIELDKKSDEHMAIFDILHEAGFTHFLEDEAGIFFFRGE